MERPECDYKIYIFIVFKSLKYGSKNGFVLSLNSVGFIQEDLGGFEA